MDFQLNEEQRALKEVVHDFVAREVRSRARHTDEASEFNWAATRKMGPLGLLGLEVPEEYGGAALDAISVAIVIEELGWGCGSTALAIAAHNGLGLGPLVAYGTEEQKRHWLPRLTSGEGKLACLSLTEPGAGSDLKDGVRTRAVADGDSWVINGAKMWMTNASISDLMVVLCRTGDKGSHALSHILVPSDTPGVIIGPAEKKMGLHGSPTHAVTFDGARVPRENLLGVEGRGLPQTLATLDSGRVGIGALALGLAQAAYEEALKYAKEREAFGQPIANFQAIQWMLADAATEIEAARLMVYKAAWLKGLKQPYSTMASMAKLFATEVSERVCRNAIQIHGGYGYSSEFEVERMYRDTRLMT
ncbi:MAG TPA: acyl-CoA dehydrogenase family protein, partial [Promineifilum sp.]|nr:acyl-CoA dehydrogenase family protein [Promineifilum sp.]